MARPLNGDSEFVTGLFRSEVEEATFRKPVADPGEIGDNEGAGLLRTAMRIGFTATAGPFRSLGSIAVDPRIYQFVPLLLAMRMDVVRLLIGDDVGIGKTIEAGLIAKELLDQGEASGLTVLCSPALAEQWQAELLEKFGIEAKLVLPSTVTKLQREAGNESIFQRNRHTVVSTDFIKSDRYRAQFLRTCPDLVIVDEAHTCVSAGSHTAQRQRRYSLLREIASKPDRHLVLVTATPHSGKEEAFRDLIGLLDPELALLDLDQPKGRERLARHFVQRRRRDIRSYLDEETRFPRDRQIREVPHELTREYASLTRRALAYARETVADGAGGGLRQRVRWWSALALLRSVASSPRAAAATLRARSVTAAAESESEAEELGRSSVLDLVDDETLEGIDATPGADDGELPKAARERLQALARDALKLEGPKSDAKLKKLIDEVKALLADGYDPIVFCRFIPTAEYVAEYLSQALGRIASVAAVTGTLPPAERQARIRELTEKHERRHVLVATDCLSEGVNLQEHFQAVIHYDLAWNPTRHEQREGRVDRFGQRRQYVRAVTLYGIDNGIDGIILDVLIRKHRTIAKRTGVAVPVPDRNDDVIRALVEGLLFRHETPDQLELDLGLTQARTELHREWESAADRESKALTKYAWSAINLDDVRKETDAARSVLGQPQDVTRFVRQTLTELGGATRADREGFTVQTVGLPEGVLHALDLRRAGEGSPPPDLVFHPDLPAPSGAHALVRTDPIVRALARYVIDAALDPHLSLKERPARRCGVIRTSVVSARTVLLLVRYRFHVTLPGAAEPRTLVAEDAQMVAYQVSPQGRDWLTGEQVADLLTARPENVLPEMVNRAAKTAIRELDDVREDLQLFGKQLAEHLRRSHRRVRSAAKAIKRGLDVQAAEHADVLGVYVYLPSGGAR
ncbi:helicase-related protein [Actinoallomurus iriomotensis]|uniref:helicase-related protein n=1 Tax=Actinoallomurus iriomotensis TaxID=478107 RepID=UPI00255250AC|nr:helicase-related protein [Actinoallomurus iriomotensis]